MGRRGQVLLLCAGIAMLVASTLPAGSVVLTSEGFQNGNVSDPSQWVTNGTGGSATGWPGAPCLTVGTDTAQSPVAQCNLGVPDSAGSGALRLTGADNGRAGTIFNTNALPTAGGLDISFHQAQYGGTTCCSPVRTGDGISFFLYDGASSSTTSGAFGQGLGYSNTTTPVVDGVPNGLLGIGFDAFGNYSHNTAGGSDCPGGGGGGPGTRVPNQVAIRGPGNGQSGYCWLGSSGDLSGVGPGFDLGASTSGTGTRASTDFLVRIVVDPPTEVSPKVTVYLDGTEVLQVDLPTIFATTPTFKFGWGASTGSATDIHEVWGLEIDTVVPPAPTDVVCKPGVSSIDCSWAPSPDPTVTHYIATTDTGHSCTATAPQTGCTIEDVPRGLRTVTVVAVSPAGTSPPSEPVTVRVGLSFTG